jgi:hypothetical protein
VARKKTEKPMPATEMEMEMKVKEKPVRLYLTEDVHNDFRVLAARERVPMAIMARRIIEQFVESKRKAGRK